MFSIKIIWIKVYRKTALIVSIPFERPTLALLYAFLAGVLASIAAQLFITPPLTTTLPVCSATILLAALLFFISSGMMVWTTFEMEAFKEDLVKQGSPRNREDRLLILKQIVSKDKSRKPRRFHRLWRMWLAIGISVVSAIYATLLLYVY